MVHERIVDPFESSHHAYRVGAGLQRTARKDYVPDLGDFDLWTLMWAGSWLLVKRE